MFSTPSPFILLPDTFPRPVPLRSPCLYGWPASDVSDIPLHAYQHPSHPLAHYQHVLCKFSDLTPAARAHIFKDLCATLCAWANPTDGHQGL